MKNRIAVALLCIYVACLTASGAQAEGDTMKNREEMINHQLKLRGIQNPRVLAAMRKVKRHLFVHHLLVPLAYSDSPLPIGHKQTISQPYIVAYMTQALELKPTDRVLEIGTGSGYQAAILAEITDEVFTIEIVPELAENSKKRLADLGYSNVRVKEGDGYLGWPEESPFDAIIVTAAPPKIPQTLIDQLGPGGRLIAPVGTFNQVLVLGTKTDQGVLRRRLLPVRFVPMVPQESLVE